MKKVTTLLLAAVLLAGVLPRRAAAVDLNLNAKSALLMDVATGTVLYEKECHERLAPASVTKVMTMLLIMEALDDGRIHLEEARFTSRRGKQCRCRICSNPLPCPLPMTAPAPWQS